MCDIDVWEQWKNHNWIEDIRNHYVVTKINGKIHRFHQVVLKPQNGYVIDHINRNKLDNRRENLRYATYSVNRINSNKRSDNTSGRTGVYKAKNGKWIALISVNHKLKSLGYYQDINDAIKARINAEKQYYQPVIENETC